MTIKKFKNKFLYLLFIITMLMQACGSSDNSSRDTTTDTSNHAARMEKPAGIPELKPAQPKPDWAPGITGNMQVVLDKLASYGDPALESLPAVEARKQHTPTHAVIDVMKENGVMMPPSLVDTSGTEIPVTGGGSIHARIYTPKSESSTLPVIVYYHGGGWVIADLDTYDASAKGLAEQTGAIVISIHYRQGPEHKFPTAHNDAFIAYQWVLNNAASFKGDAKMVAVAGESAGGNLACNMSIMARDKGIMMPVHQLLVYPVANNDMNSVSYQKFAKAKPLNKPLMEWFAKNYLPNMDAAKDPRISLVNANLKGLPPTTIIAAEIDPLATEGELLTDKLKQAGVTVNYKIYNGVAHEFFGMAAIIPEAKEAQALASAELKKAFNK